MSDKITRRRFLKGLAATAGGAVLTACQPQIVKETVIVEKPVEKVVKETVVVEKPVEKVVKETVIVEKPVEKVVKETVVVEKVVEAPKEKVTLLIGGHGGSKAKDFKAFWASYPETEEWLSFDEISYGSSTIDVVKGLRLALASGSEIPDLIDTAYEILPEFVLTGNAFDIRGLVAPYYDDLTPGAIGLGSYRGGLYGIPKNIKIKIWFYRNDLVDNAGIDLDAIETFDDFVAAGKQFRAANPDSYWCNVGANPAKDWYNNLTLSHWPDARFCDDDGSYMVASHPAFTSMFQWLKTLRDEDLAWPVEMWTEDWEQSFQNEKMGGWPYMSGGTHWITRLAPEQGGKWSMKMWPEFCRGGGGGGIVFIPNGAAHPEAAFEYARMYYLEPEGSVPRWKLKPGILPVTKRGRQACKEAAAEWTTKPDWMSEEDWKVNPVNFYGGTEFLDEFFASEEYYHAMEADPAFYAELEILARHLMAYLADESGLEESLEAAQKEMEQQIGNPYDL